MRYFAIFILLLIRAAFYTTFVSSLQLDRYRQSVAQTLRASTVRGHLRNLASAGVPSPCAARRPKDCCHRRRESSSCLCVCWQKGTDGRFAGSAVTCRRKAHTNHRNRASCPSRQWPQRCAWPRPCPARATPVAASRCVTPHCRAPQSVVATRTRRSPARPRCEDPRRAPPETVRSAPCLLHATRPPMPHDPQRSRPGQFPRAWMNLPCVCAKHPAYARSVHALPKTPCAPARSA